MISACAASSASLDGIRFAELENRMQLNSQCGWLLKCMAHDANEVCGAGCSDSVHVVRACQSNGAMSNAQLLCQLSLACAHKATADTVVEELACSCKQITLSHWKCSRRIAVGFSI